MERGAMVLVKGDEPTYNRAEVHPFRSLGTRAELRGEMQATLRLAVPVMLAQLGLLSLGAVDTAMVGRVSSQALAALSLGNVYTFALLIFGHGILLALDPLISQAHGARDAEQTTLTLQRGAILALFLSLPFILLFLAAEPIFRLCHQPSDVVPIAVAYTRALAPGVPAFFAFIVVRHSLQGMSIVYPGLAAVLVGNALNVLLNVGLIFGRFGLPALGAEGSAWATTLSRYAMVATLSLFALPTLRRTWRWPSREIFRLAPYGRILRIGLPIGLQHSVELWCFGAVALLVGLWGALPLAANQIALNLASVALLFPLGFSAAAATRVGNAIGRGDALGARRAAWISLLAGTWMLMGVALTFAILPGPLASLFTSELPIARSAAALLPIAAVFQLFSGAQVVGSGILRGAADTHASAGYSFCGYWLLGLPLGSLLAFRFHLGPPGLWWGLAAGLAATALLFIRRIATRFREGASIARVKAGTS